MKILVYHRGYSCDTGCCGHAVAMFPDDYSPENQWDYYPEDGRGKFDFSHPYDGEKFEFAKRMVAKEFGEEHVKDLDYENSFVVDIDEC